MCGIAGQFDPSGRPAEARTAGRMVRALAHRGPDGFGCYASPDGAALLVHTRLSIVDLAGGGQPLSNEDATLWAVVNGELYDDAELRAELEGRGHRFRTQSDSELVLHLYEELGDAFPTRLRGEFAVALFDERTATLVLARDRFGIKPLFYRVGPEGLTFGSEVKALFARRDIPRAFDPVGLRDALRGVSFPGQTVFEGVRAVEPGTTVRFSARGLSVHRYWDVPFASLEEERAVTRDDDDLEEEFRARLEDAVRVRLRADVPVGAYLSGGVDSTAVVALTRRQLGRRFPAFTVAFDDPAYDESAIARETASRLDLELSTRRFDHAAFEAGLERAIWHSEIPVFNAHGAAKGQLAELARTQVKVVLTGEGADELLAGYGDYRHQLLLDALQADPKNRALRRSAARFGRSEPFPSGARSVRAYRDYDGVVARLGAYPYSAIRFAASDVMRHLLARDYLARVGPYDLVERLTSAMGPGRLAGLSSTSATQLVQMKTSLPGYILNFLGDRQEMAHAIEGRVPFLDHPLVEFAAKLPTRLKVDAEHGKLILRRALAGVLPRGAAARPKKMFLAPTGLAFAGRAELRARHLAPAVIARTGVFRRGAIRALSTAARCLPARSGLASVVDVLLMVALSTHVLSALLVEDFEGSLERFGHAGVYGPRLAALDGLAIGQGRRVHWVHGLEEAGVTGRSGPDRYSSAGERRAPPMRSSSARPR